MGLWQLTKWPLNPHRGFFIGIIKESNELTQMIDPRFEDEAIAALMEEALSETTEETKFDVEKYIENSNFDW